MREIDVIDVAHQEDCKMLMREWTEYYNSPDRRKIFNVISLEFSNTRSAEVFKFQFRIRNQMRRTHYVCCCAVALLSDCLVEWRDVDALLFSVLRLSSLRLVLWQNWVGSTNTGRWPYPCLGRRFRSPKSIDIVLWGSKIASLTFTLILAVLPSGITS